MAIICGVVATPPGTVNQHQSQHQGGEGAQHACINTHLAEERR